MLKACRDSSPGTLEKQMKTSDSKIVAKGWTELVILKDFVSEKKKSKVN
jgi:hypothetical protein